ncbi:MAG: ankyrin repeat domain-containing protein [Alphaproteobacteria bacterium]|nr:ankyrin repeat domain-containing protein [Alphaproteobacteria bacterium]
MTPEQLRTGDLAALESFVAQHGLDVPFDGTTPLGMVAFDGKIRLVKWMLAHGASVDFRGEDGRTPLMWAVVDGRTRAAELLLDAGADVNATDADGMTVLHLACRCPRRTSVETARLLRARGADRFGKNADGRTAYQYAMARPPGTWVTPELLRELM